MNIYKQLKSVAYSSQGTTPVKQTSAVRRESVINITLRQVYYCRLS